METVNKTTSPTTSTSRASSGRVLLVWHLRMTNYNLSLLFPDPIPLLPVLVESNSLYSTV